MIVIEGDLVSQLMREAPDGRVVSCAAICLESDFADFEHTGVTLINPWRQGS